MDLKIILYMCNWGPHAAYQTLMDRLAEIPASIKMVRIPCSGRISKALLFKPFEMGADGVALVGCNSGACQYGMGTSSAHANASDTREILNLLGLDADRLRLGTFGPDEHDGLLAFLSDFANRVSELGKSPVRPPERGRLMLDYAPMVREAAAKHQVHVCQDCGKCSGACPLTVSGKPFSPRAIAHAVITGDMANPVVTEHVWSCLTCGVCYERCPSAVNFPEFVRDVRHALSRAGRNGHEVHGGFFQSLSRTMTSPDLPIRHWDWLPDDIVRDQTSKVLYFGGCAPYFDVFFGNHLGVKTRAILADGLRLLNFFDIHPALLDDERCCGHDLLWSGDRDNFEKLARLNVERIHDMGVEEVVVGCPEGYRTLVHDYPAQGIECNFKVTYLLDLLEREIDKGAVGFDALDKNITFQDPCRMSRLEGRPDIPRKLLARLNGNGDGKGFVEMRDRGANGMCCGNCAWSSCDAYSKAMQKERLRQAAESGGDLLVTSCPKCQIHLTCSMKDPFLVDSLKMEVSDIVTVLAKAIQWE
ncbi:MAG: hydrogenase iron-sulfur subunit [Desulfatibacillaceae bacterium]